MRKEMHLPPGEREEVLREIESNQRETEAARQNDDQQQLLSNLERGLYLQRRLNPENSEEVALACRRLCEVCNAVATSLLSQQHLKGALELLKRAEQVAERSQRDKAITWNNLACYYRRVGKLRVAVNLLERALEIEEYAAPSEATQTHLNLCATLSQLGRHADALYHAQSAMIRIYELLSPMMMAGKLSAQPLADEQKEQVLVLCIAYHNTAVEHEYLKNFDGAICAYTEGFHWATRFLSPENQLVSIMKDSIETVKVNLKPGSGALKRVDELLNGDYGRVNETGENQSLPMGHLVTPRGSQRVSDGGGTEQEEEE